MREEFGTWARATAERYGYRVEIGKSGPEDTEVGAPTQRALFQRCD